MELRRGHILQKLNREGNVSVAELSRELGTTPVTIRSDLTALEQSGKLVRVQGGAMRKNSISQEYAEQVQPPVEHINEKRAIAQAVAAQIQDGDTLFLNSGTTSQCVAEALCSRKNLNIVTNCLAVATKLGAVPTIRVALLGGEINAHYGFTYGGDSQEQLSRYQADWVILSVEGISLRSGITTHHAEEAVIDRMMMDGARKILIAADHSKIGHVGFARVCEYQEKITLVTDDGGAEAPLQELKDSGWNVICVQNTGDLQN